MAALIHFLPASDKLLEFRVHGHSFLRHRPRVDRRKETELPHGPFSAPAIRHCDIVRHGRIAFRLLLFHALAFLAHSFAEIPAAFPQAVFGFDLVSLRGNGLCGTVLSGEGEFEFLYSRAQGLFGIHRLRLGDFLSFRLAMRSTRHWNRRRFGKPSDCRASRKRRRRHRHKFHVHLHSSDFAIWHILPWVPFTSPRQKKKSSPGSKPGLLWMSTWLAKSGASRRSVHHL